MRPALKYDREDVSLAEGNQTITEERKTQISGDASQHLQVPRRVRR